MDHGGRYSRAQAAPVRMRGAGQDTEWVMVAV